MRKILCDRCGREAGPTYSEAPMSIPSTMDPLHPRQILAHAIIGYRESSVNAMEWHGSGAYEVCEACFQSFKDWRLADAHM